MPQGESPTVGGGSPQRAAVPDRGECAERPGWEEGRRGRGMSRSRRGGRSCLPGVLCRHQVLLLPAAGTVTPLRHLVGTSQVCGALFLLFPSEPQACGSPEGGRPSVEGEEGTMPGPLRAAMSNSRRWLTSSGGGVAGRDGGRHTRGLRGEGRP